MAGYRRFIAYVYDYENGKKGSNCGFIKVEVKDQQCSVEVHLHCPGLPENVMCRVYGFTRKDGLINGILLDSCETEKEIIECLIVTDAMNMNESGISLGKMGGMIIITDNGGFFGTEWDDQPIRPENFRELKAEASSNTSASPIIDKASHTSNNPDNEISHSLDTPDNEISHISDTPIDRTSLTSDISDNKTHENISSLNKININSNDIAINSNVANPTDISASSTDTIQEITIPPKTSETEAKSSNIFINTEKSKNISENDTSTISINHIEHSKNNTSFIPADYSQDTVDKTLENTSAYDPSQSLNNFKKPASSTPSSQQKHNFAPKASRTVRPQKPEFQNNSENLKSSSEFFPFSDGELALAWKIHLNDLKRFPRQYCALRNNRFIQYGHYNFGHLLLGKKNNGQYILGVPGSYNQQERFMANMFGFPYFKESDYIEMPKTRGGYWYRLIDAPDSHR